MSRSEEYAALAQALARWQASTGASELHGSLSGYLCAGGRADAADWLDRLEVTPGVEGAAADALLREMFERTRAQFAADPAQVEPLLPPASAPLAQRAPALVEWCRGFLGGFGLGGAAGARLPAEGEEILADLGAIAATRLQGADADEEASFGEVLAYVRTAVALLHRHVSAARRSVH